MERTIASCDDFAQGLFEDLGSELWVWPSFTAASLLEETPLSSNIKLTGALQLGEGCSQPPGC